jgi:hypothetical protein
MATVLIRERGTVTAPAVLMIGAGMLAIAGSLWLDRMGGHVLRGDGGRRHSTFN